MLLGVCASSLLSTCCQTGCQRNPHKALRNTVPSKRRPGRLHTMASVVLGASDWLCKMHIYAERACCQLSCSFYLFLHIWCPPRSREKRPSKGNFSATPQNLNGQKRFPWSLCHEGYSPALVPGSSEDTEQPLAQSQVTRATCQERPGTVKSCHSKHHSNGNGILISVILCWRL